MNTSIFLRKLECIARDLGVEHPIRVLVVDDNASMLKLITIVLERCDQTKYKVLAVNTFEDAVKELINGNPFDICLVDQRLGKETGIELIARCQSVGVRVPFLLITAFPEDVEVKKAVLGQPLCVGFLSKDRIVSSDFETQIRFAIRNFAAQASL